MDDRIEVDEATRRAPVQRYEAGEKMRRPGKPFVLSLKSMPAGTVAWSEHLEAWSAYAADGHGSQSAERVAERGGFGYLELVAYLGRPPATWEPR